jgi:hypothetical protein
MVDEAIHLAHAPPQRHARGPSGLPACGSGAGFPGDTDRLPAFAMLAVWVPDSLWPRVRAIVASLPPVAGDAADPVAWPSPGGVLQA